MKILKILYYPIAILLLLFLLFVLFRKNHIKSPAKVKQDYQFEQSQFLNWNDLSVHFMEKGHGNQTIFMVHGLGGAFHEFLPLANELSDEYRIVLFDLPGFGLSESPTEQVDIQTFYSDFMTFMLNELATDTTYIIGNSMGGLITWNIALKHPEIVDKMVLLAPAGYDMIEIAEKNAEWINKPIVKFMLAKGAAPYIAKSNVEMCFYNNDIIPDSLFERKYAMMNKEGNLQWLKQLAAYKNFTDTSEIQKIQSPALVVWGDKDEIIPFEHAAKFERDLPNNQLIIYTNCGHVPMLEYTERCANDIRQFLTQ